MDLMMVGDLGSGCEDENCGLASAFPEDCLNQDCQWDEPVFGLIELVCVTVFYIPLMIFGLLGNILTILVVWLRPHMRSSTYLYLSSMAVSDLLILLLLPLDLYKLWRPRPWPLGDIVCKLTMFLSECCTYCTILHITFLSLERYLAVCWPITAKTLVTRRRTRALIGCLWLSAAVSAAPVLAMVGVEEVEGEERGLSGWREDKGWAGKEGEQGGFMIGGGERGSGHMASMNGGLEEIKWGEKEKMEWGERDRELRERKVGIEERDQRKQGDGKINLEKQADDRREQNKKKEDEGGGWEEGTDGGPRGQTDKRECRCTHYAVSSGLLSAMVIISNLYFLVPLGVLGVVYSLIGRTLWLRPQSSRRDQSHRHTVKMLGVIVLAFVLCWLPFHVGRTIFSFTQGIGSDGQETYTDTDLHLDINGLSDVSISRDVNIQTGTEDSDTHFKTGKMTAHTHTDGGKMFCDNRHTEVDVHLSRPTDNREANTLTNQKNRTHICINTQNNTPPTAHTYTVTATNLYTHNETHFDTHSDTHLYFYYLSQYFNLVSSVLFYLSAAINPLLYNLMSAKYRHAVHSLIRIHSHTQSHRLRTLTARHSTTTM